jgi:hypothetical protein
MPSQTAAANYHPFHCMMPPVNPVDASDPLPALRREMKLLLVEQDLMRVELEQRRAIENEMHEAKEFIRAYVERVEQLSVREAAARKEMEFWRREAERLAQERPRYSRWAWQALRTFHAYFAAAPGGPRSRRPARHRIERAMRLAAGALTRGLDRLEGHKG